MRTEPAADQTSIVLVGNFNPRIFNPSWLALNGLISREDADSAKIAIIHADVTQFIAAYMTFEIQPERFVVRCDTGYKNIIKDLVLSVFGEHLPHVLVRQLGINRNISFSCGSERVRDKFGNTLAPKLAWGPWGNEITGSGIADVAHGGLTRLIMRQQPRPDGLPGIIQADLRPSISDRSAIDIDINNHFEIATNEGEGCAAAVALIESQWMHSMKTVEYIVDGLMERVEALQE